MIYSIHDNGDLLAADISSPSGNINVISYMPITVQVITRADTFFMIGNNANTELNKYQGELTLFCTGSASYSVYKNNYIAANRLGTASPNTAFNITKNWIGSIFVDDTGTSSAPGEIFKLYIFKGMLSTQECLSRAGFRGEDHIILDSKPILPAQYQELEYIESTGTQWIDTGYIYNDYNDIINIEFAPKVATGADLAFFGSYIEGPCEIGQLSAKIRLNVGLLASELIQYDKKYSFSLINQRWNDNERQISYDRSAWLQTHSAYLFCRYYNGSATKLNQMKAYKLNVINRDNYKLNLIPCLDGNNTPGMYDTVSERFLTNQGTGSFIAGPIVNNITQRRIQA